MTASELIEIAAREIGTKEIPAGSNNVIYNDWYYGHAVSGAYAWCVVFCQWVYAQAGLKIPYRTASCTSLMDWARKNGCWVERDFRPGDVIIMQFSGGKHAGICEAWDGATATTIEGNTSASSDDNGGAVMRRTRPASKILGAYRHPDLEEDMTHSEVFEIAKKAIAEELKLEESRLDQLAEKIVNAALIKDAAARKTAEPSAWSAESREWAEANGIILGNGSGMAYRDYVTREEMTAFLMRLFDLLKYV